MSVPGNIDTVVTGVPMATRPVFWNLDDAPDNNAHRMQKHIDDYSRKLPTGMDIDEVAVMVPTPWHEEVLGESLRLNGWERFNEASDLVYTTPFGTRYFVHYAFYRHPSFSWRLEVMYMDEGRMDGQTGFSPLHAALWENGVVYPSTGLRKFPVPHLSFKPKRRVLRGDDYHDGGKQTWRNAYSHCVQKLQSKGFLHAQTCQSTYGLFSYWLHQDATHQLYVKPRLNLRDEDLNLRDEEG